MNVQHSGPGRARASTPTRELSGVNGGSAKPFDDGKLIRQWCPAGSDFTERREDRIPPTTDHRARTPAPDTLLN